MPIDIRLTTVPAPADVPLAAQLATLTAGPGGEPGGGADIVVAVQGAETAGLDPYLGGPVAGVLAAYQATGEAGEVPPVAIWLGGRPHRLSFLGLGDGSAADLRKAGTALGRRAVADRVMIAAAVPGHTWTSPARRGSPGRRRAEGRHRVRHPAVAALAV